MQKEKSVKYFMGNISKYIIPVLKKKLQIDAFSQSEPKAFNSKGDIESHHALANVILKICTKYLFAKAKNGTILYKGSLENKAKDNWDNIFPKKRRGIVIRKNPSCILKEEIHYHITTYETSLKNLFNYEGSQQEKTKNTVAWCFEYQCWEELSERTDIATLKKLKIKFQGNEYDGYEKVVTEIEKQIESIEQNRNEEESQIEENPKKELTQEKNNTTKNNNLQVEQTAKPQEKRNEFIKVKHDFSYKHINNSNLETLRILFIEKVSLEDESDEKITTIDNLLLVLDDFYYFFEDDLHNTLKSYREIFLTNPKKNIHHFSVYCDRFLKSFKNRKEEVFDIAKQLEIKDFLVGKWENIKPHTKDSIILYLGIDKKEFIEADTNRNKENYLPQGLRKQIETSVKEYPLKKSLPKKIKYALAPLLILSVLSILYFSGVFNKSKENSTNLETNITQIDNNIWDSKDPKTFKLLIVPLKSYSTKQEPLHKRYNYKEIFKDRFDGIRKNDSLNMEVQSLKNEALASTDFTEADAIISKYNADIVIWGDVDDDSKDPLINLSYSLSKNIYNNHKIEEKRAGNSGYGAIKDPIYNIRNGSLQAKIDDIVFWVIALNHFDKEQYDKVISSMQNIDFDEKCKMRINELVANSYLQLNKYSESLDYYNSILSCALKGKSKKNIDYDYFLQQDYSHLNGNTFEYTAMSWSNISKIFNNTNKPILANSTFKKAVELWEILESKKPNNYIVKHNLGVLYSNNEQIKKARLWYKKAININDEYIGAWVGLGQINIELKDHKNSLIAYEKLIQLDGKGVNNWVYWGNLGHSQHSLGFIDKALQSYEKSIELNKKNKVSWYNKGNALRDLGKVEESIDYYKSAIGIDDEYIEALFNLAKVYSILKNYSKAIDAYKRMIEIDKSSYFAWNGMGYAYKENDSLRKSEESYLTAYEIKKDTPYTLNNLAVLYLLKGENNKAISFFKKSISSQPSQNEIIEMIEEIKKNNFNSFISYNQLGQLYISLKQIEKAKSNFHKALSINKNQFSYIGLAHSEIILKSIPTAIINYKLSLDNWDCSEEFFKSFDNDFEFIEEQGVSEKQYQTIKQELKWYCENKQ